MEPSYINENRYSYLVGSWQRPRSAIYVTQTPEGEFEQHLQDIFVEGQTHLQHEEYTLALQRFNEAMALILRTVHPATPLYFDRLDQVHFPNDVSLIDTLVAKAADVLVKTPAPQFNFPTTVMSTASVLSPQMRQAMNSITDTGLQVTSFHSEVQDKVSAALNAATNNDWKQAIALYQSALDLTPATELGIRAGLMHDMAILNEKDGNVQKAQDLARLSVDSFAQGNITEGRAEALSTASGIFLRAGNVPQGTEFSKQLETIKASNNLGSVVGSSTGVSAVVRPSTIAGSVSIAAGSAIRPERAMRSVSAPEAMTAAAMLPPVSLKANSPELMGLKFIAQSQPQKKLTIRGLSSTATIALDSASNSSTGTLAFLKTLADTKDIGLLVNWMSPYQFVAYIPHMYFYILPMSIGDCHLGMGNLEQAQHSYQNVLAYPYINVNYEIVKVWTRLAQTFIDLGDQAYRNAKDDKNLYGTARTYYEKIVLLNKTLDSASPLYADAKFAGIKTRVTSLLGAADPAQVSDNPAILAIVLDALSKLQQIQAELNFFGFSSDYVPPFSFEYLQNTARYYAEQASHTEQRYIQYKSQAENEQFRRDQLNQQAEVARQSVILEQRGVTEAQRGIDVANAGVNYAGVQLQNAVDSKNDFNNARWELLALTATEAWASAASVKQDDEVLLTAHGFGYYSAKDRRRSAVLQDLAYRRTLISHDLEASRLDRAVGTAQAYRDVARAQVAQAAARLAIAQQRVKIAQLQQRQAEENRDFLDMREFSAQLWYELAQQARRLKQRYLDMATGIAFLMERAYNAETERGLSVIRYDYQNTPTGNLMGADLLLADIDSFTFDYVTTTKTKKNPVKKTISVADSFPTQFHRLLTQGRCTFETSFADFDREHPGLYLAKIRNVEVIFVGLAGERSIAGTLRNIGVSRFRLSDGAIVNRLYPADVMVLSQYEIRQDALAFRFNPNDLRLFENNGIETLWQLDLPLGANDFDYDEILDVHLVLYYDGFFSQTLESQVIAALPSSGSATRAFSMKFSSPDELFYLKNQGEAELVFDAAMFPRNQKDPKRTKNVLKLIGQSATTANLKLRLVSDAIGSELVLTTDPNGEVLDTVPDSPLKALQGKAVLDRWRLAIRADDNPQLVQNGKLNLTGLDDLMVFFEYQFNYR